MREPLPEIVGGLIGVALGLGCMGAMLFDNRPPMQKIEQSCRHNFGTGQAAQRCVADMRARLIANEQWLRVQRAILEAGL